MVYRITKKDLDGSRALFMHNDLIDVGRKDFTAKDMDMFVSICFFLQDKRTNVVEIPFNLLKELSKYRSADHARFVRKLKILVNEKVPAMLEDFNKEKGIKEENMFAVHDVDDRKEILTVAMSKEHAYLLNRPRLEDFLVLCEKKVKL